MTSYNPATWLRACTVAELKARGVQRVAGSRPVVSVFYHDGRISAVDNRCPHLGFPLHRGTVADGVLTCHWHHADFDLCSGCTYNLFADDVPSYDTHVEGGVIFVAPEPRRQPGREDFIARLHKGMDQNVAVIIAKSVDALLKLDPSGGGGRTVILEIMRFGSRRHARAVGGMTNLSIAATLLPYLTTKTAYYILFMAAKNVADNCAGQAPRMLSEPLDTNEHGMEALTRWFRRWAENGQITGCERTILTVAKTGATTAEISGLFFRAATDRIFAVAGQALPMSDKGFELIEYMGREYAGDVLPLLVRWVAARGSGAEDQHAWNNPVDLIAILRAAEKQIRAWLQAGKGRGGKTFAGEDAPREILLGDDPHRIIDSLGSALSAGAAPEQLAKLVAYAAARRLAHFALSNELQDWQAPARTFTYANAMHQVIRRSPGEPELVRGLFHGAMAVYMDRFLNVPAVPLPGVRIPLDDLPSDPRELCRSLLNLLDQQASVEEAARTVARFVRLKHPLNLLFSTLTLATVREDLGFPHWLVLEAGIRQAIEWEGGPQAEHILVGVVRHLAVVCPTPRSQIKPAQVGLRLNKGERLYEARKA